MLDRTEEAEQPELEAQLPESVDRLAWRRRQRLGRTVHRAFESLDLDWQIVRGNSADVVALVEYFKGPAGRRDWTDVPKKRQIHVEATRRLANFLASGRALMDHPERANRRLSRELTQFVTVPDAAIKAAVDAPWQILMRAMCDMTLHAAHQNSVLTLSWAGDESEIVRAIQFDVSALLGDFEHQLSRTKKTAGRSRAESVELARDLAQKRHARFDLEELRQLIFTPLGAFRHERHRELVALSEAVWSLPIYKEGHMPPAIPVVSGSSNYR